jgi:hypothetical protein
MRQTNNNEGHHQAESRVESLRGLYNRLITDDRTDTGWLALHRLSSIHERRRGTDRYQYETGLT